MTQTRVSQKRVNDLCNILKFRLVQHEHLGNAKDYYYSYSLVFDDKKGNYKETILRQKSLKFIWNWMLENGIDYLENNREI